MSGGEIFGYGWREDHARAGDRALKAAESLAREPGQRRLIEQRDDSSSTWSTNPTEGLQVAAIWAAIAQAHYTAANVELP